MKYKEHYFDVCVVGGGLAGMCAAISAARHGSKVALVHDRPVFGGNCSSEIRMWPLGARGRNCRETGIFEEIVLENMRVNPMRTYPIWDAVLYSAVNAEENITTFMNCTVNDAKVQNDHIISVSGWQLTTYITHTFYAHTFIDCSGDSIIARLSGAEFRVGRESKEEFGELAAPDAADSCTMGNSLMIQVRETAAEVSFVAPKWIRKLDEKDLTNRYHGLENLRANNFWWLELGGDKNSLDDCEEIAKDLLALSYGTWDHIKNGGDHSAQNWDLDWAGYLSGKRESARCIGDHILTQNEVAEGTQFDDIIAYGGWPVDNHPPKGFWHDGKPNRNYPVASPFGIPYRCLYSRNIDNLLFAGRNISVTHCAMAASRVMATCAILGQAAGTAAALTVKCHITPREVLEHIRELQEMLMHDDCWLPGRKRTISRICQEAELTADCDNVENLRNGIDRPTDEEGDNGCFIPLGSDCTYTLKQPEYVQNVRIIFDSDLNRDTVEGGIASVKDCPTICNRPLDMKPFAFQTTMTDTFQILADGQVIHEITGNRQRHVSLPVHRTVKELVLRPTATCGNIMSHVFAFDFE